MLVGFDTIAEATHVLSRTVIQNYFYAEGKKYLDSREIVNQADLLSALQSFRAITITGCFPVDEIKNTQGKDTAKVVRNAT